MNKWKSVYSRVRTYLSGKGNRDEQVLMFFRDGNDNEIVKMIQDGLDVQSYRVNGFSLLHLACQYGRLSILQILVKMQCDLSCLDSLGNTPAYYACLTNNRNCIQYIASINPSLLSSRNHVGVSPLDMIQDFAFRDEIVNESSSVSKHSLGEMYLPVLGKEHIPPMMEMLLSNIYKHPLDLEDIRKLSSKSYGSRLE